MSKTKKSNKFAIWIQARKKFHLSHMHIQMARELGLNPKKFGKLNNYKQEPWKLPLPLFIEELYLKQFKREKPDIIRSIEDIIKIQEKRKNERKQKRLEMDNNIKNKILFI